MEGGGLETMNSSIMSRPAGSVRCYLLLSRNPQLGWRALVFCSLHLGLLFVGIERKPKSLGFARKPCSLSSVQGFVFRRTRTLFVVPCFGVGNTSHVPPA